MSGADVRETVGQLREILGTDRHEAAYEAGASLAREDAIAELRKQFSPA